MTEQHDHDSLKAMVADEKAAVERALRKIDDLLNQEEAAIDQMEQEQKQRALDEERRQQEIEAERKKKEAEGKKILETRSKRVRQVRHGKVRGLVKSSYERCRSGARSALSRSWQFGKSLFVSTARKIWPKTVKAELDENQSETEATNPVATDESSRKKSSFVGFILRHKAAAGILFTLSVLAILALISTKKGFLESPPISPWWLLALIVLPALLVICLLLGVLFSVPKSAISKAQPSTESARWKLSWESIRLVLWPILFLFLLALVATSYYTALGSKSIPDVTEGKYFWIICGWVAAFALFFALTRKAAAWKGLAKPAIWALAIGIVLSVLDAIGSHAEQAGAARVGNGTKQAQENRTKRVFVIQPGESVTIDVNYQSSRESVDGHVLISTLKGTSWSTPIADWPGKWTNLGNVKKLKIFANQKVPVTVIFEIIPGGAIQKAPPGPPVENSFGKVQTPDA